jgi:hypothetical protein
LEIGGFRRNTQHNPTNPFGDECQFNRTWQIIKSLIK